TDPALRRGQVLRRDVEVVDGVVEAVLHGTELRTHRGDRADGHVDRVDRRVRVGDTGTRGTGRAQDGRAGGATARDRDLAVGVDRGREVRAGRGRGQRVAQQRVVGLGGRRRAG